MKRIIFLKLYFLLLGFFFGTLNSTIDVFGVSTTSTPKPINPTHVASSLLVDVGLNKTIYLPNNTVTLVANVISNTSSKYEYHWKLIAKPESDNIGSVEAKTNKELKLSNLVKGEYQFQVTVHGANDSMGQAKVSVFVKPPIKKNEPPVAIIKSNPAVIQLPNNIILDGSGSTDDDKIVSYHWETLQSPIEFEKNIKVDQPLLQLDKNIMAGNYTFQLTVKDADGKTNSANTSLIVLPEKEYPPKANPGPNMVVNLPVNSAILNGSGSTDDKKIISYEWSKVSDTLTADIQGVREPILRLSNLQEGTYTFKLKVTDSAHLTSEKEVQVFVKPRVNVAPTARASVTADKQIIVRLPATLAVLNGSLSSDDEKIVKYQWQQVSGEPKLNLVDGDKPIAYVNELKIGLFKMKLTVWDSDKLNSSDFVVLRVEENQNQNPKAVVKDKIKVQYLNPNLVHIDGSKSWDDHEIVKYQWLREDDSLGVGDILRNSDSKSVLLLTGLSPGTYKFRLTVYDKEGLYDFKVSTLIVSPSILEHFFVQLQFQCSLNNFTESKKNTFISNLQLIIQKKIDSDNSRVKINIMKFESTPFSNSLTVIFYATLEQRTLSSNVVTTVRSVEKRASQLKSQPSHSKPTSIPKVNYISAIAVVEALNEVRRDSIALTYPLLRIETFICQNNCSGHGKCNPVTKLCECETFWTSSFLRERFGDGRPNCDWSIIYLIISSILIFSSLIGFIWFIVCVKRRKTRSKKKPKIRKHKYMRLNEYDSHAKMDQSAKFPKSLTNGIKSRAVSDKEMGNFADSDSNMSTDEEETLFISNRNGVTSSLLPVPVANEQLRKTFS